MITHKKLPIIDDERAEINNHYRCAEAECVAHLLKQPSYDHEELPIIQEQASTLAHNMRKASKKNNFLAKLLQQYDLSTTQGIALMCLAEALVRIPDNKTRDLLIRDKISTIAWLDCCTKDQSFFGNAANWSLALTGAIFAPLAEHHHDFLSTLKKTLIMPGIAVIRPFICQAMKTIGDQFVCGVTIEKALIHTNPQLNKYLFSFDMLGEAARTASDATQYLNAYRQAIIAIGNNTQSHDTNLLHNASISVKLSALHPRYEPSHRLHVLQELTPIVLDLAILAQQHNIGITIDAEEADRLELSLDIFAEVFNAPALQHWSGLGFTVQAYQKRAPYVIKWLRQLAHDHNKRIMLRLVKGAYWDTEIKYAQTQGLADYPVFTRKQATDLSYLVCARILLSEHQYFYPQFGTHNAHTVSAILHMANTLGISDGFEFQCLYGMGQHLYDQLTINDIQHIPVRIYAPVGNHENLVSYLIRRILENSANNAFVKQINNHHLPIEQLISDPIAYLKSGPIIPHPSIPKPAQLYPDRLNSPGYDISDAEITSYLQAELLQRTQQLWQAAPLIGGNLMIDNTSYTSVSPANTADTIGQVYLASHNNLSDCLAIAAAAAPTWAARNYHERAQIIENFATLLQEQELDLISLLSRESGKTLHDALSEMRETIDYCYYYAAQARIVLAPQHLPGPTGEDNVLCLVPRGIIACISPWNFPLAIFTGQIIAALITGNVVIAKPAEQTPIIASIVINLLHKAGIPHDALHLLIGHGNVIGAQLLEDERIAGVMFTGSTATAHTINKTLANKSGPIVPLIAETGGQNPMIVDSSALCEQVVPDIIQSAFYSSGQRCSSLRILYVQEELAERLTKMLIGAMDQLIIGNPGLIDTDIGPIIDKDSWQKLHDYVNKVEESGQAKLLHQVTMPEDLLGYYFPPTILLIDHCRHLEEEVFGPVLHLSYYKSRDLDKVLADINALNYGLTLGINSRISSNIEYIRNKMRVGNTYINRNMVGAVVGTQPFGGERLSGTGPKAGGPYYLPRLCTETVVTTNLTAVGGNTHLITMDEA